MRLGNGHIRYMCDTCGHENTPLMINNVYSVENLHTKVISPATCQTCKSLTSYPMMVACKIVPEPETFYIEWQCTLCYDDWWETISLYTQSLKEALKEMSAQQLCRNRLCDGDVYIKDHQRISDE